MNRATYVHLLTQPRPGEDDDVKHSDDGSKDSALTRNSLMVRLLERAQQLAHSYMHNGGACALESLNAAGFAAEVAVITGASLTDRLRMCQDHRMMALLRLFELFLAHPTLRPFARCNLDTVMTDPQAVSVVARKIQGEPYAYLAIKQAFIQALEQENFELAGHLVEFGMDLNVVPATAATVLNAQPLLFELLKAPLPPASDHRAVLLRCRVLAGVVALGADLEARDYQGYTPLLRAIVNGDDAALDLFLAAGADLQSRASIVGRADYTPLMLASEQGRTAMVSVLLQARANADAVNNQGETALMLACAAGHEKVVATLLPVAYDTINVCDRGHYTAFFKALMNLNTGVVRVLLNVSYSKRLLRGHWLARFDAFESLLRCG